MANKKNLLGCSLRSLEDFFKSLDEPSFRAKQLSKWIHQKGVTDFNLMTDFNKDLRSKLNEVAIIKLPKIEETHISSEGTKKYLVKLESGTMVEMVRIPEKKRTTLCISSQAGCALQCTFCATGAQGFEKNLTSDEIIGQLWLANFADQNPINITNVVFMGMGEPLLNFDPVIESAKIMKDQHAYGLSRKRITISTSGIVPFIEKLPENIDASLAISLHAPNNELRDEIVPINKKYPIDRLIKSCKDFVAFYDGKRNITIEYILIDGVNDSIELALQLSKLLSGLSCKINLIPFNPFDGCDYQRSTSRNIEKFKNILVDKGFITTLRITRGDAIDGACGQLVGKLKNSIKGKNLIAHRTIS